MPLLILVRHGESQWNLENRFTGWIDVDLSPRGEEEAKKAGDLLKDYHIDYVFTSALKRAQRTTDIILERMNVKDIPIEKDQALNERHYGDLQGLNKQETGEKYGMDQLKIWRRSYDVAPPNGESLKDTQNRVLPYYFEKIVPKLKEGKNVLISAHGNSLRALVMHLENLSKEEVLELNIPTGVPCIYELDENLNILSKKYLDINSN
ncbi:MAG: 2,3-bisphosphoglycerate-dependent phosphoglycerate mutase [Candidatus Kapabacteria bacterium]|nr:2,3-bisphosphoglycerate-dependent phosphoglycerate mutase [Candidatus Kapabacteria bacterium]